MTTIAYRDGIMAADTGMTCGGARVGHVRKIVRGINGCLAAAAGSSTYAYAFKKWAVDGENGTPPEATKSDSHCDRGVIVRLNGVIEIYEPGGMFTCRADYFAMGSGQCEARGAMHAGADAEGAVRAAIALDESTYGDIDTLKVGA